MASDAPDRPEPGAAAPIVAGFPAAIQRAMEAKGQSALVPAQQLPLLDEPARNETAAPPGPRGAGRPPGAINKRTQEWVDHILGRYQSPLIFLAETYSRPVEQLAQEIGTDKADAFKLQLEAAKQLAPYLHQKQPLAVQVDSKGVVQIVLEAPDGALAPLGSADEGPLLEIKANQGDSGT